MGDHFLYQKCCFCFRDNIIIEPSIARCKGITDGRLSYQGMNPEIERLMELKTLNSQGKTKETISADVTDVEMANYNLHVNEAVAKRFMTKHERQTKKPKFMKPDDQNRYFIYFNFLIKYKFNSKYVN